MSISKSGKWWLPFILIVLVVGATMGYALMKQTPKYKYPRNLTSYKIANVNKSPDDAVNGLFKAINDEDTALLKKCTDPKLIDYVLKQIKAKENREGNDEDIKKLLHQANEDMKKEYGENWYSKGVIQSRTKEGDTVANKILIKFKDNETEKEIFSSAFKGEYTVIGGSAYNVLTSFNKEAPASQK